MDFKTGMLRKFLKKLIPYLVIISLAVAIYANTLSAEFVFDDYKTIINNRIIQDGIKPQKIWQTNPLRFIGYLSFSLNYKIGKLEVYGYHVVNIGIHILTSLSLFFFLKLLLKTPLLRQKADIYQKLPFLASLIFVVHPIQTQAVTYITQRMTSIAALFYILALTFALKANLLKKSQPNREKKFLGNAKFLILIFLSVLFSVMAFLTKENTYTLPIAILLIQYLFFSSSLKNLLKKSLAAIPILIVAYLIASASFTKWNHLGELSWKDLFNLQTLYNPLGIFSKFDWSFLLTQFKVIIYYLKLLFFPLSQNLDYDFPRSKSIFEPATFISLSVILTIIFVALFLLKKYRLITFGILFFFLTLSIESSIFPLNDVIYEHRLYLPSIGVITAVACIFCELQNFVRKNVRFTEIRKASLLRISGMLIFSAILLLSIATINRNKTWTTQISIWSDTITKSPNKARPYNGLGIALFGRGQYGLAAKSFQKAIEITPQSEEYTNLGKTLIQLGKYDEAAEKFEKAIKLDPYNIDAVNSLKNLDNKRTFR